MIFWIVPGVVNRLELVILRLCSKWQCSVTTGMSGPRFEWNCGSRELASSSARSMAGKTRPLGPVSW